MPLDNINIGEAVRNYNEIIHRIKEIIIPKVCELLYLNDINEWELSERDEVMMFNSEDECIIYENKIHCYGPHFFDSNSKNILCFCITTWSHEYDNDIYKFVFIDTEILKHDNWAQIIEQKYVDRISHYHNEYLARCYAESEDERRNEECEYNYYLELKEKFKDREMKESNEDQNRISGKSI